MASRSKRVIEEWSVIKSSVAEKCKPCEIYRRMCDVYRCVLVKKKKKKKKKRKKEKKRKCLQIG